MTKRLILTIFLFCSPLWATTYYVDNCVTVGNDLNNGASPSMPWRTINKVNTSKFNPGDSILFQSTCTWREQLTVPSSGSAGSPITFGANGTGAAPIISGADVFSSWITEGSLYYSVGPRPAESGFSRQSTPHLGRLQGGFGNRPMVVGFHHQPRLRLRRSHRAHDGSESTGAGTIVGE